MPIERGRVRPRQPSFTYSTSYSDTPFGRLDIDPAIRERWEQYVGLHLTPRQPNPMWEETIVHPLSDDETKESEDWYVPGRKGGA